MAMEQAINLQSEGVSDSTGTNLMYEKVERVNALLQSQEPENVSVDTYGGYTGYKPQYIINAMNRVFGLGKWGFKEISNETRSDEKGEAKLVIAKVQVWIDGVDWQPEVWGQNRVTKGDLGDADKGADTDGMKKGLSYFSIGSRAFEGKLSSDDAQQYKEEQKVQALRRKQEAQEQARAANANGNVRPQRQSAKFVQAANAARPQQAPAKPAQQVLPANTAPTALQPNAERPYLPFFSSGREKGLWSDFTGFCQFATAELGVEVNRDNVRSLTSEQLAILDIAIKEEAPVKKTA